MNSFSSQQYSQDEVTRIIRRALKLDHEDTISHEDLLETAGAIGLDRRVFETAISQEQAEYQKEKIHQARMKRRRKGFYSHLLSYLIVNAALLLMDSFTPGPWWFQWSVFGWGIGLAFHFKALFFPPDKRFEKRIRSTHNGAGSVKCSHRRFDHARTQP
jgi:hypothetical protein